MSKGLNGNARITVHRFADPDVTLFDPKSPFTTKLECVLRMSGTEYGLAKGFAPRSPTGKVPYITVGGKAIGDSTLCYQYLQTHEGVADVDAHLTAEERALTASHKAWIEEWCYFLLLWDRYIENHKATKEGFFRNALPPAYRPFTSLIFAHIRRYMKKTLHSQGVSRHSKAEILSFISEAAKHFSVLCGEHGFLDGRAATANACLFGHLITIYNGPTMSPNWYREISKYPNLRKWTEGMIAKYFGERNILPMQIAGGVEKQGAISAPGVNT